MAYVYKKFTAQDKAIIPFNAHKQYNFDSSSAASNSVKIYPSRYTSESVSIWSGNSGSDDTIHNIRYNQIDHLFYRNHIKQLANKKDYIHLLKNRKDLYEKANILSVPSGLYGFELKKSSFYLTSSTHEVTEDSFGNLIISGTNVSEYPTDVQQNVFRLDPIKGFKHYDQKVFDHKYAEIIEGDLIGNHRNTAKQFYRQGLVNAEHNFYYTTTNINPIGKTATLEGFSSSIDTPFPKGYNPQDTDDSYFFNEVYYNNVSFNTSSILGSANHKFPVVNFHSHKTSSIKVPHNPRLNFNRDDDFAVSFYMKPKPTGSQLDMASTEKRYIIAKSGTKTVLNQSSSMLEDIESDAQFPFEIYVMSQSLYFERSDGYHTNQIIGEITNSLGSSSITSHILCQQSASTMEMWFNGTKIASTTNTLSDNTANNSNLYIGSKGKQSSADSTSVNDKHFNGELSNINIWSRSFKTSEISNISESINASPYIGNIFYTSGFAVITHPKYHSIIDGSATGKINTLQFQGTHLIWEHEYQCTCQEHEFNSTTNSSAIKDIESPYVLEDFTTGSFFKPYVTTIGLYNEGYELLAIAKLGQPIRMSDETDTTFVVRWDT